MQKQIRQGVSLILDKSDISYTRAFGQILTSHFSRISYAERKPISLTQIKMEAAAKKVSLLATTSFAVLKLVRPDLTGTASENEGCLLAFKGLKGEDLRIILLPRLATLFTQKAGKFLLNHFCEKLAQGGILNKDKFTWAFVYPENLAQIRDKLNEAKLIAVDIETTKQDLAITSVAYTCLNPDMTTSSYVVKCSGTDYPFCIDAVRVLNGTKPPKIMQNGKYDAVYFLRFNAPLDNWLYDTAVLQHCLFCELPKDLAFISSMYLGNYIFWKDDGAENLYEYNAKDTHNTLWVWLAQMKYIKEKSCEYALKNYLLIFPVHFPAISCALDGLAVDENKRQELLSEHGAKKDSALARIHKLLGQPLNPNSPKQVKTVIHALGAKHINGTDKKAMIAFRNYHPLNARIVDAITEYRKATKLIGTYLEADLLHGMLFSSLDPCGTETGRMASRESSFWCGSNIQNQPPVARKMIVPGEGWSFVAVDKSQSESYCTGHLAKEPGMLKALYNSPDFHCHNASMFFAYPFEELWDAEAGKPRRKDIRDLSKRVNHGANYNMMARMLLETMGDSNVFHAKQLLKLPEKFSLIDVCEYLLGRFDATYPRIRGDWQKELVQEVLKTKKLTIPCIGYTRRTFLKPWENKLDLNTVCSHKPQSLSVHLVNKAFVKVWRELQLVKYRGKLRLKAQVHDELLNISKDEVKEAAAKDIADYMVIPTMVEGKLMTIPSTIAFGKTWAEAK